MGDREEASGIPGLTDVSLAKPASTENGDDAPEHFQCSICLDLLYKPVVLECGHISCFWCVHRSMNNLQESHCPICRHRYKYFPSVCPLLHHLLLKLEPAVYRKREKEVLEEEKEIDCFSPQFVECATIKGVDARPKELASDSNHFTGIMESDVTVSDVLCSGCKEILFQPIALNCGHVYCRACLCGLVKETIKCQCCGSLHPGDLPNVCLDLDHFLKKQFSLKYFERIDSFQPEELQYQCPGASGAKRETKKSVVPIQLRDGRFILEENLSNAHVGVGCDSCGMYPIIGKRYKCKDCKEKIGFDLCDACYNTTSKRPGRFNQQHTPDHVFIIDDSAMLANILRLRDEIQDQQDLLDADGDSSR